VTALIDSVAKPGDLVVASIHWGGNWGYAIPGAHRSFAHDLIDRAGVHLVHGHSSHHPLGIEVYRDRPILYGCGDLINDYEGIAGHEEYQPDLGFLYLVTMGATDGRLQRLELVPVRMRRFRLELASGREKAWLHETQTRLGKPLGTRLDTTPEGHLLVGR
jgi:poly-gamma-glutamate synthesis protein (capsule biosynthesis protein)